MGRAGEHLAVRPLVADDIPAIERILRDLPEWFGIETSVIEYVESLAASPGFVAIVDGEVAGFLALKEHNPDASEVHVMAVQRDSHRNGVGRALVRAAEAYLVEHARLLQVKTLGPSQTDPGYARTRSFYLAMGFIPLEETTAIWGDDNPCLIMVKPLVSR
jgi:N-acetylglutamate synthase-like GNAT family acetyltransferase